jgi:FKBP-type peptidyl-prolyl cis-trans isomerase
MASGIDIEDLAVGDGPVAERGKVVSIRWRGTLNRGDPIGSGEVSFRAVPSAFPSSGWPDPLTWLARIVSR